MKLDPSEYIDIWDAVYLGYTASIIVANVQLSVTESDSIKVSFVDVLDMVTPYDKEEDPTRPPKIIPERIIANIHNGVLSLGCAVPPDADVNDMHFMNLREAMYRAVGLEEIFVETQITDDELEYFTIPFEEFMRSVKDSSWNKTPGRILASTLFSSLIIGWAPGL